jgi:hypothetical protein
MIIPMRLTTGQSKELVKPRSSMSRIRVNEIGFEGEWSIIVYRENGGSWMRMTSTKYVPLKKRTV